MRTVFRYLALGGVVLLLAAAPISARKIKIKCDFDKSNDFARYKRYTTGKNYLLTHQTPEVQARIDKVLVESLDVDSGKIVWTARASEKIQYPRKTLKDLRKKVDDLMARTLKSFPPSSGAK
jgi:hypothetical protein